jgi:hypothetical protein
MARSLSCESYRTTQSPRPPPGLLRSDLSAWRRGLSTWEPESRPRRPWEPRRGSGSRGRVCGNGGGELAEAGRLQPGILSDLVTIALTEADLGLPRSEAFRCCPWATEFPQVRDLKPQSLQRGACELARGLTLALTELVALTQLRQPRQRHAGNQAARSSNPLGSVR